MAKSTQSLSANGSVIFNLLPGDTICRIMTYGTFSCDYNIQASLDGVNFVPMAFLNDSTYSKNTTGTLTGQTAGSLLQLNCSMLNAIKVTVANYISGTLSINLESSPLVTKGAALTQIAGG